LSLSQDNSLFARFLQGLSFYISVTNSGFQALKALSGGISPKWRAGVYRRQLRSYKTLKNSKLDIL
jgi:hypothetical protein